MNCLRPARVSWQKRTFDLRPRISARLTDHDRIITLHMSGIRMHYLHGMHMVKTTTTTTEEVKCQAQAVDHKLLDVVEAPATLVVLPKGLVFSYNASLATGKSSCEC